MLWGADSDEPGIGREDLLPIPVDVSATVAAPSAGVRAYVQSLSPTPLTDPVAVDLVCLAEGAGKIVECVAAPAGVFPRVTYLSFLQMAQTDARRSDHSVTALARLQARQRTIAPDKAGYRLVRLTETVGGAKPVTPAATPPLSTEDVVFDRLPDARILSGLYPVASMRRDEGSSVTMRCTVTADHMLTCADGVAGISAMNASQGEAFIAATLQAFSGVAVAPMTRRNEPTAGRVVELRMRWTLGQ